jgi:LysR family transcriptional activator of nhaA
MVCKQGSVSKAADALYLTPQTVTGQIKLLEERLKGKLLKKSGRSVEPTELGHLVFKYADKMYNLSYEMLDIVNYSQRENWLFEVGVADALSKRVVSQILSNATESESNVHIRCFESTHEHLLEKLSQHKLDMIISDCPIDVSQSSGLFSKKLGEVSMSFFSANQQKDKVFPENIESYKMLLPSSNTSMGRKVWRWFDSLGVTPNVLGEFDDVALMKAFAEIHREAIFIAPTHHLNDQAIAQPQFHPIAKIEELQEEYHVIFAERMIQHPAVKAICELNFKHMIS